MSYFHLPNGSSSDSQPDWHVLVLFADDTDDTLKGLWGPYSTLDNAMLAMEELRNWPIDGRWDIRRLNKFVALKLASGTDNPGRFFTWQTPTTSNA